MPGVHNFYATACRIAFIFIKYGRQWIQDIFALLLFCFHTLSLACFHMSVCGVFLQSILTQLTASFYNLMRGRHKFILNYMRTAAYIFIEGRVRPQVERPCTIPSTVSNPTMELFI